MPIIVDSSQWTGEPEPSGPVVWGTFADRATLDRAATRLRAEPWFQAVHGDGAGEGVAPPDVDPQGADRRNLRQNVVGSAAAAASMLAAGIVIATGGAALPAVAAAAAAGVATGAVGEAAGSAMAPTPGAAPARQEGAALGVMAPDHATRHAAEGFLHAAGATRIWIEGGPAADPDRNPAEWLR